MVTPSTPRSAVGVLPLEWRAVGTGAAALALRLRPAVAAPNRVRGPGAGRSAAQTGWEQA